MNNHSPRNLGFLNLDLLPNCGTLKSFCRDANALDFSGHWQEDTSYNLWIKSNLWFMIWYVVIHVHRQRARTSIFIFVTLWLFNSLTRLQRSGQSISSRQLAERILPKLTMLVFHGFVMVPRSSCSSCTWNALHQNRASVLCKCSWQKLLGNLGHVQSLAKSVIFAISFAASTHKRKRLALGFERPKPLNLMWYVQRPPFDRMFYSNCILRVKPAHIQESSYRSLAVHLSPLT